MEAGKLLCSNRRCGWNGTEPLTAPNPFDPGDTIFGCPKCKDVNTIIPACDEPGCWKPYTSGTPTPTGYRQTCSDHAPKVQA